MEIQECSLFSIDANAVFASDDPLLDSHWLEGALRYIAIKNCNGNVAELKPIRTFVQRHAPLSSGDGYVLLLERSGRDIFVVDVNSSSSLPTVNEDGWQPLNQAPFPVANFLSQICPTNIFINTEKQKAIVFVRRSTLKWGQVFASSLMRILPWFYPDNSVIAEEDKQFFKAISEKNKEVFISLLEKAASTVDIRAFRIERALCGWNNAYRSVRIKELSSELETMQATIEKLEEKVATERVSCENKKVELNAMISTSPKDDSELSDFFRCHKQLSVLNTRRDRRGSTLEYSIIDTIEYYDQDAFISTYKNKNSYFYDFEIAPVTREIFYAIFALRKGKLRTQACFELRNTSALVAISEPNSSNYSTLPHPHIGTQGCLGENLGYVREYMKKGAWEMAIEQTIAAAKNIHFGDSIVVSKFMRRFHGIYSEIKCIVANNGVLMTPTEFYEHVSPCLREQEEENLNG